MTRYRIIVEYDGSSFAGWQRQENVRSLQGEIEGAILRLCGETVTVRAAGRTDAGVHALGQVAHFDLARSLAPEIVRDGLNAHLRAEPVTVLEAAVADPDFDARFSATGRRYVYRLLDRRAPPALDRGRVWHVRRPLDLGPMREAAATLLGTHDFTTFRSVECQAKSPVKTLDRLEIGRAGDEIRIEAAARSFLHSQVRSIVGSLVKVGAGAWPPARVAAALAARDRAACGPLAPPHGLYLAEVRYDGPGGAGVARGAPPAGQTPVAK